MLVIAGLVMLVVWIVGIVGVYDIGDLVHIFLMGSLFLLLVGALKSRDSALAERRSNAPASRRDGA